MEIDPRISFEHADVGGLKLHYAIAGSGQKLVILLHGFPEFWYSWRHQLIALSDEYTVVAPDMRGYNLSDRPPHAEDYSIDKLVGDVVGLIRHFGVEKAAVIGHDWGAAVAWALAIQHPEVVWKLGALQVPPLPIWKRNRTFRQFVASWYMLFFQLPALPEFIFKLNNYNALAKALRDTTARPGTFGDDEIDEYRKAWSKTGATTAMLNYYRAANVFSRMFGKTEVLPEIDLPTLFVYGEKDTAVLPATVVGVGDVIKGDFTEHRIPDSGHWVQQEAADEVTGVIREFLKG